MFTAYKYRIYPNRTQQAFFEKQFFCCRYLWNKMLEDLIPYCEKYHRLPEGGPGVYAEYAERYEALRGADPAAMAITRKEFMDTYNRCLREKPAASGKGAAPGGRRHVGTEKSAASGKDAPGAPAHPKFRPKTAERKSYSTASSPAGAVLIGECRITLPLCGSVPARVHRMAPEGEGWKLTKATVRCDADGKWYCSVLYAYPSPGTAMLRGGGRTIRVTYPARENAVFRVSGGGMAFLPPGFLEAREEADALRAALGRKQGPESILGPSRNYLEVKEQMIRARRRADRRLSDSLHKLSDRLTDRYDLIIAEPAKRAPGSGAAKHAPGSCAADTDAYARSAYAILLRQIAYKQEKKGHRFILEGTDPAKP